MTAQRSLHSKPVVFRRAVAAGELRVALPTLTAIRRRTVEKGDPVAAGELAGLSAMKRTSELIPHCHAVPLSGGSVVLTPRARSVAATATAEAIGRTGVEMEALVGVSVALLTVWDMVKYLEKDERGGYPTARIDRVRVIAKTKRPLAEAS